MHLGIKNRIAERAEEEKALFRAGEAPRPRIKNQIQRTVVRLLVGFLAFMLVFTIVSSVANGATVARVQTDTFKSGVLTNRTTIDGQIEAEGDISIALPEGLRVETVYAKEGQRVSIGDALLRIDLEEIRDKLTTFEKDIRILKLKIEAAESGVSGGRTDAILAAQEALDEACSDYDRLIEKLERQNSRSGEDYQDLLAALEKAEADYEKIVAKTRDNLIKAASDAVTAAEESLESTQESAADAIRQAEQTLSQASDTRSNAESTYYQALSAYATAKTNLDNAKKVLSNLVAADEQDLDLIAKAQEAVSDAQSIFDAASSSLDAQPYSSSDYSYAKESLEITKEQWEKSVQKAKDALAKAKEELSAEKARTDYSDEPDVISAQSAVDSAKQVIKSADRDSEDSGYSQEEDILTAQKAIDNAERDLENAQKKAIDDAKDDDITKTQAEIDRLTYEGELEALEKQQAILENALENDGVILSAADGTVLKTMKKGSKTTADTDAVTISRSDQGFVFEGSVAKKEAKALEVGDTGKLSYTYEGKSHSEEVQITSIGTPDEEGNVGITARLPDGSYPTGVSGGITITEKSEKYDSCLPLSALRTGSNGDYVLVLREKSTVMGTERTVVAIPVTVKDKDSELMSIESSLLYDDRVVTSANKPISEGDSVRLES